MGQLITLEASDGHRLNAWEAGNADSERAVVIIQEIFGLTNYIKNVCQRFVDLGYHAIAPALFDRAERNLVLDYNGEGLARGMELYSSLDHADSVKDCVAAADHLRAVGHDRVGALGFCWGGLLAWRMATETRALQASVAWYGGGIANESQNKPHCPVQLHFGGQDTHIPHTDVLTIRKNQPDVELFVYDDAEHGFGCTDRSSYNADAEALAWQRTVDFLSQHA